MHMFSSLCESHTISSDSALHAAGSEQNFGINIRWNGNIQVYQIIRTLVSSLPVFSVYIQVLFPCDRLKLNFRLSLVLLKQHASSNWSGVISRLIH